MLGAARPLGEGRGSAPRAWVRFRRQEGRRFPARLGASGVRRRSVRGRTAVAVGLVSWSCLAVPSSRRRARSPILQNHGQTWELFVRSSMVNSKEANAMNMETAVLIGIFLGIVLTDLWTKAMKR